MTRTKAYYPPNERICTWCAEKKDQRDFFADDRSTFWCKACVLGWLLDNTRSNRGDIQLALPVAKRNGKWTRGTVVQELEREMKLPLSGRYLRQKARANADT